VDNAAWAPLLGKVVVVDTDSKFVYVGTLARVEDHFLVLENVDAHDSDETPTTKEQYVMECRRFGVNANRKEISVRKSLVVSVSKLDDVIPY
jgi:small nuclear ribonucleoprotein (snRNP)-like protein